jgi:hypothetical protein
MAGTLIGAAASGTGADVDDLFGLSDIVRGAPRLEELTIAAKRSGPEAELRHLQTRFTQLTIFHEDSLYLVRCSATAQSFHIPKPE